VWVCVCGCVCVGGWVCVCVCVCVHVFCVKHLLPQNTASFLRGGLDVAP
jgi:hypothetical protein